MKVTNIYKHEKQILVLKIAIQIEESFLNPCDKKMSPYGHQINTNSMAPATNGHIIHRHIIVSGE